MLLECQALENEWLLLSTVGRTFFVLNHITCGKWESLSFVTDLITFEECGCPDNDANN